MTMYDTAFGRVFRNEGGFQNNHRDRGNWTSGKIGVGELKGTKFGLSAMTYPHLDIISLTLEQAKAIYKRDWWDALNMKSFRPAMQYQMFDAAINHGMFNTTRILQYAASAKADGIIGPNTRRLVAAKELNDLLLRFLAERLVFMTHVKTWDRFGKGWARRIAHNLILASDDN